MILKFNVYYLGSIINSREFTNNLALNDKKIYIILHGLFGRGKNWHQIAKTLSTKVSEIFITIDLRNHGDSISSENLTYTLMAQDIFTFIKELNLNKVSIIGHSMGGKVAMMFTLMHKNLIENLIIVDIAPVKYLLNEKEIVDHLLEIDIENISSRKEAETKLDKKLKNKNLTLFLLQNLIKTDASYKWLINLKILKNSMNELRDFPINNFIEFNRPILCIFGENSNYVTPENKSDFRKFFPKVIFHQFQNTGHWLHAEKPKEFVEKIVNYLISNQ